VRFLNRKYNLDFDWRSTVVVANPDRRGVVRWENFAAPAVDSEALDQSPDPQARFASLEAPFNDARILAALQKDFMDWVYRTCTVKVRANEELKVYAGPEVTQADFTKLCADAARQGRDDEVRKISDSYDRKLATIQDKLAREERELASDKNELSQRKMEELGSAAESIFGLFSGRKSSRRISSALTKRRLASQAKDDVEESQDAIGDMQKQVAALEKEKADALAEVNARWGEIVNQETEIPITPLKKDVLLDLFGVAWMPYHMVQIGNETRELPGYGQV